MYISIKILLYIRFRNYDSGCAPFFLFGDFNFRTDTKAVISVKFLFIFKIGNFYILTSNNIVMNFIL